MKVGDKSKATLSREDALAGVPEDELTPKVHEALAALMNETKILRAELDQMRKTMVDLERLADRDPMLDLLNRRAFIRELERTLAMIDRHAISASLIFVDLNDLKKINDSMGHAAGDAALSYVASSLAGNVRQVDYVGRLGGDEFGVLLTHAPLHRAQGKARLLSKAVSDHPVRWKEHVFTVNVSCGVVEIVEGLSAEEAMERADQAMYAAKAQK